MIITDFSIIDLNAIINNHAYWCRINILGRENENNADGKILEKLILGDYEWMSYKEVKNSALNFGASLRFHLEQQPKSLITIFAETRAEWMIACFGSYTQVIVSIIRIYDLR